MNDGPPIPLPELCGLFEYLERISMTGYECDHTFSQTSEFLKQRSLPSESMLTWLAYNGAGCDCEVMFNVAQQWEVAVGYLPQADDEA